MRIEKVTIKNFRNYIGEHHFELNKDITIFYGDNGFGKSSFFDAIEWCLSGTISRFSDEGESEKFKRDLINRYELAKGYEELECSISLEFNDIKLNRKFNVRNNTFGKVSVKVCDSSNKTIRNSEGKLINSKERVDEYLSGLFQQKINANKNLFGKLMKQTYILSQDQITEFISSEDPVETFRSIANIMGFKPMLKLSDNLKKVHLALEAQNRQYIGELNDINGSIKSKQETKREIDIFNFNDELGKLSISLQNVEISGVKDNLKQQREKKLIDKLRQEELLKLCNELKDKYIDISNLRSEINRQKRKRETRKQKIGKYKELKRKIDNRIQELKSDKKDINNYNQRIVRIKEISNKLLEFKPYPEETDSIKDQIEEKNQLSSKYQFAILNLDEYWKGKKVINMFSKVHKEALDKLEMLESLKAKRIRILGQLDKKVVESEGGLLVNLLNNIKEINNYLLIHDHNDICPVCSSVKEEGLLNAVDKNITSYRNQIDISTAYADKLFALKNNLRDSITNIDVEIKKLNEEIKILERDYNISVENIERIETNRLFVSNLFDKDLVELKEIVNNNSEQIKKFNKVIDLLLELEKLTKNTSLNLGSNFTSSEEVLTKRISRLQRAKKRIITVIYRQENSTDNEELIIKLESYERQFIKNIPNDKLGISFSNLSDDIKDNVDKIEKYIQQISKAENSCEILEHNNHVQNQIETLVIERDKLNNKISKINSVISSLSDYRNNVFGNFGNSAKDYLNKYYSPIQKYFRFLNPLPTRSSVRFEGEGERLFVKVIFDENDDENDITTPKNVLSSGQLNVLAISLFLAMNDSQKIHELDFIAIDDPIQNMDDINQFSICDVLGSIQKQIIFSTHDFEFLKLFIKKNEHRKEDIQVFDFKSPFLIPERINHITFTG